MKVRPAAVAGTFYPSSVAEIRQIMDSFFTHVAQTRPQALSVKALIVPHAGYIYSGLTAAFAYHHLQQRQFKRVVLLGPTHRVPVYGLALPDADCFSTPLGLITLDKQGMTQALTLPCVSINAETHRLEHSLEVQLPFLQRQLGEFELIPFAVGQASAEEVAQVLELFWNDSETVIIISSDLSHFHPYEEAKQIDRQTCDTILQGNLLASHQQACGATPVNGLLAFIKQHPTHIRLLDCRNSADTAGDKDSVVGYGSFAFTEDK